MRRQVFPAICADCGKETKVIFEPRGDRPVYCRKCFDARRRGLSGSTRYRCEQCGKYGYGNHFKTDSLCKKCAAKRANLPVELADQLVITTNVHKRLTKKAEAEIPPSAIEEVANVVSFLLFPVSWISCPFVARIFFDEWSGALWFFIIGWALLLPTAGLYLNDVVTAKPRQERREQVKERVLALAQKRQETIEEREAFYSSPEWKLLRDQVIREEGRTCADCGRRIKEDADIAVDHKRPRSKYPELALKRDNLRVLCRRCNSRKAARDWMGD
jgi:CxxC-x17-CxxC domain-containing protein